jgi:hypothetical protein
MPDGVVFALPTLSSNDMPRDDQGALIVNQATAVIVAAYLEHASAVAAGDPGSTFRVNISEVPGLIDQVQNALRTF